jgi:DNA polymerase-1
MESYGVRIDVPFSVKKAQLGVDKQHEILKRLKRNPGSSKDLKAMLIDELGLPVVKLTKSGLAKQKAGEEFDPKDYASFDKEAMAVYDEILERRDNPLAKDILAYRGWNKTTSSNYKAYLSLLSPDGRLRPNYKLHGTKTGRSSCEQPNLQQIPRESDKEWNGDLKQAFIADEGYTLWEFDYSQLELRLATAYADERELKKVFADPTADIFTQMAGTLGFTRQDTKTFVYSVQYGAGLERIAAVFKVSRAEAEAKREAYRNSYPGFRKVEALASARCKAVGKVALWSGRYRHFWSKRDDAHKAFNSVIQGGAADIVEHVMVKLWNEVNNPAECRMLLTVHDSVVFEIRNDCVDKYVSTITSIMTNIEPDFGVTFAVDAHVWGSK